MTLRTQVEIGEVNGREVTVIDTPGQLEQQQHQICCRAVPLWAIALVPAVQQRLKPAQPALSLPTSQRRSSGLVQGLLECGVGGHKLSEPLLNHLRCPTVSDTRVVSLPPGGAASHWLCLGVPAVSRGATQPPSIVFLHSSACHHRLQPSKACPSRAALFVSHCFENGASPRGIQASCTQLAPRRRQSTELEASKPLPRTSLWAVLHFCAHYLQASWTQLPPARRWQQS